MEPNNNQPQTPPPSPAQNPAPQPETSPPPPPSQPANQGMSNDTRTLIVILLLIFFPLVGIILMWAWMKTWPVWLKTLITLPAFLTLAAFIFIFYIILNNPVQNGQNNTQNEEVLEETPSPSPSNTPTPTASPSAEIEGSLKSALDSKNYEEIVPLMAQSVQFEIEASEGVPEGNPQQTVESLSYLDMATSPWNFDQNDPIITEIKEDNPEEYGNLIIGIASNDVMSAFGLNADGKIDIIKVAVTYEIMITQ